MLDKNQKRIYEKIQKENGKNNVFIITGVAGSGKTTLISELSKKKGVFDEVLVSSLTGKACQVLKNKGVVDARTIQSFLYGRPRFNIKLNKKGKLKKIAIDLFEKLNTLKLDLKTPKNRLFIFDEASMIIDVTNIQKNVRYNNQSKSQLDEIISRINSSKGKFTILMVGDRNQLPPPVPEREDKLPYSDALSKEYWKLNGFKTFHFNLEKSYRIREKSTNADFIKLLRSEGKKAALEKFSDSKSILLNLDAEEAYIEVASKLKKDHTSARFISSTNYGVYKASTRIKELITNQKTQHYINNQEIPNILDGDLLEISKNNYSKQVDLFNGDIVKIISSVDLKNIKNIESIDVEIPLNVANDLIDRISNSKLNKDLRQDYTDEEVKKIKETSAVFYKKEFNLDSWTTTPEFIKRTLHFCDIKFQHLGFETGTTNLTAKVLLNSINIPKIGNSKAIKLEEDILEQCIQQYVLEQFPTDGIEDEKIIKKLQEKIETHPYANALWCNWGYAGTCHTSQGSEWEYVVVDLNYAENFNSSWVYTALTRSQNTICILNLENYKKSFISEDLNLTDVDDLENMSTNISSEKINQKEDREKNQDNLHPALTGKESRVGTEKRQSGFNQLKNKIGGYFSSSRNESELFEEFNNIIDSIHNLPLPVENESVHLTEKRKNNPRYGMPWTTEEEELFISLINATLVLSIFKKRTPSELVEYLSETMGRNSNSVGLTWLKFYTEGLVDMPRELITTWQQRKNESDAQKRSSNEATELEKSTLEEETNVDLKRTAVENIIGTLLTNKQLSDLQDLLSDSANIGIEEDPKDTGTFFEDEDPF